MALITAYGRDDADPATLERLVGQSMDSEGVYAVVLKERGHVDRSRGEGRLLAGVLPEPDPDDPLARPGRFVIEVDAGGPLRVAVDLLYGTNTGLFPDARPLWRFVRERADGRRVLNLFSYTSVFGVAAALGGARSTTNVDLVPSALERGQINYTLNGLAPDARSHTRSDVFEFLRRARKRGTRWDLVVCDPPPVPTAGRKKRNRKGFDPAKDMERLLGSALAVVEPGGGLLALSATRGTSRFEEPLAVALASVDHEPPSELSRASDFPGDRTDGLRAMWVPIRPLS